MKKTNILLYSLLATISVSAQEVVATQGDSYSTANGNIDFTIGEVVTNTVTDASNTLTQGFHQTNWSTVSVVEHMPSFEASIYPNPTQDVLNIKSAEFAEVNYSLYDAQGKLIFKDKLTDAITPIQVSQLATGNYSVVLSNSTQNLKTFQLIKTY